MADLPLSVLAREVGKKDDEYKIRDDSLKNDSANYVAA
jgi:hypothetical protein